jgi:methylenetetrahydrofolate reductase (NADPH)
LIDDGPDDVLRGLWASSSIAKAPIAGLHFFPFGGLRKTAQWLRSLNNLEWSRTAGGAMSPA